MQTWRRLQQLGAVSIRNAVYVLPDSPQTREDFEWLKAEILANRGEASVFAADTVDTLTHDDIVEAFRADRRRLYDTIAGDVRKLTATAGGTRAAMGTDRRRLQRLAGQLRERFANVVAGDYFAAPNRAETESALVRLERLVAPAAPGTAAPAAEPALSAAEYRGRTWLTRPRPGMDRCASAWLIRRFVDPRARFSFGERPDFPKAIPFDMYGVEFSHHDARCTFEVLADRFGVRDPAVLQVGRVVHDLDLKETRYAVPEASTVGRLVDGLRNAYSKDEELIEHGIVLFESLYRSYSSDPPPAGAGPRRRRRPKSRREGR